MLICMKHANYSPPDCEDCRDEQRLKLYPKLVEAAKHLEDGHSCRDYRGIAQEAAALDAEDAKQEENDG